MPLQRAITDFGADHAYGLIPKKLKEHYGIEVPVSSSRKITQSHGSQMLEAEETQAEYPDRAGAQRIIAETDGCYIPLVEINVPEEAESTDGRKHRKLDWAEARLSLSHEENKVNPYFAAVIGFPDKVGDQLFDCAFNAGFGKQTYVHAVGDGASWIAQQVDRVFASQGNYLIDFSHLMGYLDPAAKRVYPMTHETWMTEQKNKIKDGRISEVVQELEPYSEPDSVPRKEAPVRTFCSYVSNRPGQFEYKSALESNLPIGSGEIESAHRYVIQYRLKIAGAWWKKENAQKMLALRVVRQNNQWEDYWEDQFSYLKAA